jgi:hypothetical protein
MCVTVSIATQARHTATQILIAEACAQDLGWRLFVVVVLKIHQGSTLQPQDSILELLATDISESAV